MQQRLKRAIDVAGSAVGIVITLPVLAVVALAIRLTMGAPCIFRQPRGGFLGKPFVLYKFRTMSDAKDTNGKLLPDAERLTGLGGFIRSTSLDELPQLWNVLCGDMSLVGPRPLLVDYLTRYDSAQKRRHAVKPGITGWAQIQGRNATSWEQRFEMDIWYVDHFSLILDLKILAMTLLKVLTREGTNRPGHATMPEFLGPSMADEVRRE